MKFIGVLVGMWAGLAAGNFIYQSLLSAPDYGLAIERSWFQAVAVFAIGCGWLLMRLAGVA